MKGLKLLVCIFLISILQRITAYNGEVQQDEEYYDDHITSSETGFTQDMTEGGECKGTGPVKASGHCQTCRCDYGKIKCSKVSCEAPYLQPGCKLVNVTGSCCPEMQCGSSSTTPLPKVTTEEPECDGSGPVESEDPCESCICKNGEIVCHITNCPKYSLKSGCKLIKVPGKCCQEINCVPIFTTTTAIPYTPRPECTGTGPVTSSKKCQTCRCVNQRISCAPVTCPRPYLQPGCKMIKYPDECCEEMECEDTTPKSIITTERPECFGTGPVKNKDKCQNCRCNMGKIICSPITCPQPYVQPGCKLVKVPGECCEEMECETPTTEEPTEEPTPSPECYGSGVVKSPDACKSCKCNMGKVICNIVRCSQPKLGPGCQLVTNPGQCCPEAKCETTTTQRPAPPECSGNGPVPSKDKCKICHCLFGKISCKSMNCPQPILDPGCELVDVPGQCCPEVECEDLETTTEVSTPPPECYGSASVKSKDICKTCRCNLGKIICTPVECSSPNLRPGCKMVKVPGRCCSEMKCEITTTLAPVPPPECTGSGPVTSKNKCKTCRCLYGKISCVPISCPRPYLEQGCELVNVSGECCPEVECEDITTTPEPDCYGSGAVKSDDPCKSCRCSNGDIICSAILCSPPKLGPGCKYVKTPGQCCPSMKCEPITTQAPPPECTGSGPVTSKDKCKTCHCMYGKITCTTINCPRPYLEPGCQLLNVPGECCPEVECDEPTTPTPECTGSGPVTSKDKCKTCRCLYGKISCTPVNCPKPRLEPGCQLVDVPGECCPEIECEEEPTPEPDCYGSGPVKSQDPCQTCRCNMGEIVCNAIQCDQPKLGPGCKMVKAPGQCCPSMKCDATTTRAPPPECTGSGPVTSRDKCKTCHCMYGKISCTPVNCPRPYLEPGCKLVNLPGECCPEVECEVEPTPEPDCYGSGSVKSQDPCKTCRCSMGEIVCNAIQCSQPKLEPGCKMVKMPGQCCPSMKCEPRTTPAPPPECTGNGLVTSRDKCKKCICVFGKISCNPVTCPKPLLEPGCELVNVPGECCPEVECEEPPTPEPDCYGSGPVKSQDPCKTCRCNMGEIVCSSVQCSQPKLEPGCKMVKAPGQCCPSMKCEPRTTPAPPPECTGSGPVTSRDKCKTCHCTFGKIICSPITCQKPYLEPGCELVDIPGECCPEVECEEPPTPAPDCYGSGPVKSQDPCQTCRCNMGEIVCNAIRCSQPKLEPGCKLIKAPGQCCPSMKCDEMTTTVKPIPPSDCTGLQPVNSNDPCKTCRCNFGNIICSPIPCQTPYGLQPGCKLIKVQGQCCPQVQCDQRTTVDYPETTTRPPRPIFSTTPAACYGSGSVPAKRPCETCQCVNGKIICKSVSCPRPLLKPNCRTESMPGKCCPEVVCDEPPTDEPECDGSGPIDSENPCESCKCFDGEIKCVMVRCPTPMARSGCRIAKFPGKCCPELVCDVPVTTTYRPPTSTPACYGSGPVETDIPCAICECLDGFIACKDVSCPNFHLNPGCKTVQIPGKCCPEMKCDISPPPTECRGSGPVPSGDICEECMCIYGRKQCHKKACPPSNKPNASCRLVKKEGCCCPEWECVEPKCIPGKPIPSTDPCEICHCMQGNVRCVKQQCKPAPGQNCRAVPQQNKCCPVYECDPDKTPPIPNVYG